MFDGSGRDYGDETDYDPLLEDDDEDFYIDPEYLLDDDEDFEYEPAWYEEIFEEEEE